MNSDVSNAKKNETTKEKEYKKYINFGKLHLKEPTFVSDEDTFIDEMKKIWNQSL